MNYKPLLFGLQESELNSVDAELALQMKIYEAARKLCEEERLSKAVKKSRIQQCKREEKKLKQLQERAFKLRLEHGRSSPLPAFNLAQLGKREAQSGHCMIKPRQCPPMRKLNGPDMTNPL